MIIITTAISTVGCKESIVLVISTLKALMLDQKQNLSRRGLVVEYIGETQKDDDAFKTT